MSNKIYQAALPDHEQIEVLALNDLHVGSPDLDVVLLNNFIQYIQAQPNRFIILAGDLCDNALKDSVSDIYGASMSPSKQIDFVVKKLQPIQDRILAAVSGNHEWRTKKHSDIDPSELIAAKLGVKNFNADEMFLKVTFGKGKNGKPITYSFGITHGSGGGGKPGAGINRLESYAMNLGNVDIVIMGHVHRLASYRFNTRVLDLQNNVVREVEKLCMVSGSWLSFGGYASRMMLTPGAKGPGQVWLSGRTKEFRSIV